MGLVVPYIQNNQLQFMYMVIQCPPHRRNVLIQFSDNEAVLHWAAVSSNTATWSLSADRHSFGKHFRGGMNYQT